MIASKDYHDKRSKLELNEMFNRAVPFQCMQYSCAKFAITLMNLLDVGPPLSQSLKHSAYVNDRLLGQASMMDSSRLKIGKSSA